MKKKEENNEKFNQKDCNVLIHYNSRQQFVSLA